MKTLSIVGSQWGDEGKGKVTDVLSQRADVVVRYQGGNNAGHTIIFNNKKYALQSIPSGVFSKGTKNVIANGMVLNINAFLKELDIIKDAGFDPKIFISNRAHVILPLHQKLDEIKEELRSEKIGTTKKGIGPTYEEKASRTGIRVGDLLHHSTLLEKVTELLKFRNPLFQSLGYKTYDPINLTNELIKYAKKLKPYICDTSVLLNDEIEKGSKVLFEGAQGIMLCIEHGTYPMVTSSSPLASSIPISCGIAPRFVQDILGIVKAYTTRVGGGPFPTEIHGEIAERIRNVGKEFGTVTGRKRRIGWLDIPLLLHSKRVSGLKYMSIMLLDVLSGIKEIKIGVNYKLNNKLINYMPSVMEEVEQVEVEYITMPGWKKDITDVSSFDDLPKNAQNYLLKIQELTGLELAMFSVGPDRKQTIELINLLE